MQDEAFLEDVNMILNTGDVPNIYENDEKAEIIEKVWKQAVFFKMPMTLFFLILSVKIHS